MPSIRKKTTRRGTTNQREKIKHKAAETRKKRKRDAKKNPQWKSKQKKDPGIPNNFPYKDQILAEVEEQRRQAEEEKQRRKEEKKALKAGQRTGADAATDDEGSEVAFDGIAAIPASRASTSGSKTKAPSEVEPREEAEAPVLLNHEFPTFKAIIDAADVVIEVLDARDPLAYHSEHAKELTKARDGHKFLLVLNKIAHLRTQYPTVLFRSASAFLPSAESSTGKGKGKERADDAMGASSVIAALERWAVEKTSGEPLLAAVVGFTNSGKSALINSLARKSTLPVYKLSNAQDGPTTTIYPQEVTLEVGGKTIRLVDTPGFAWLPPTEISTNEEAAKIRSRDILVRNKGRIDRLKDPEPVVHEIVARASREDLMLFYNLPAFAEKDTNAFLSALARANGLVKKGGVLDIVGASRILLRDWSTGKFPRFTLPPPGSSTLADTSLTDVYATDEKTLATLPTRKERRKADGVVKLSASPAETRTLALEVPWTAEEAKSDGEEEGEEDEGVEGSDQEDVDGDDKDEGEEEYSEGEEDDEEEAVPPPGKRKRSAKAAPPSRPAKKVAFASESKSSKQARSIAGARRSLTTPSVKNANPQPAKSQLKTRDAKTAPVKKVANAAPSKKSNPAEIPGDEAYDFKKFF
ncbi:hypothetical protein PHLGIDRAFT_11671 [Phlebiopsis gigantea 11061_1 CR5-6]|uniref:CP-type G domain-containing protein n=1 Tax=Phlebiopsis gigantea (strain 11061_1 CR5-6) TaxID=745531 RepID=A0A0C3NWP7_PHLG1|nr:hypothetical protein PHLGIDRAFT_11671 [Phlebiopsis gigantea 11061_1 CR5-6]